MKTIRYLVLVSVLSPTALVAQSYTFEAASVKTASPDNPPGQGVSRAPGGRFTAVNAPLRFLISMFANGLSNNLGRAVVDRTGLIGNWAFELTYAPEPSPDSDAPSLFTAIQEELGLKLESTKAPVEVLVIDSVQRPTPD